jgi:hypothetical protein
MKRTSRNETAGWLCRSCRSSLVAAAGPEICPSCGGSDWCLVTYPPLVEASLQSRRRPVRDHGRGDSQDRRIDGSEPTT